MAAPTTVGIHYHTHLSALTSGIIRVTDSETSEKEQTNERTDEKGKQKD